MVQHAEEHGANAIIGMRYDATEFAVGVTEVLAYGTAVRISRLHELRGALRPRNYCAQPC